VRARKAKARRVLILQGDPSSGRTPAERLGLELRSRANLTGRCVCGAVGELRPHPAFPGVTQQLFLHEADCPVPADGMAGGT
jgi:hypothetical protein